MKYSIEFKAEVVKAAQDAEVKDVAKQYGIDPRTVKRWIQAAQDAEVEEVVSSNEVEEVCGRFCSHEQMVVIIQKLEMGSKLSRLKALFKLMAEQLIECERGVLRKVVMEQFEMSKHAVVSYFHTHAREEYNAYKAAIA
ncbi:transposase [Endozoicomonas sp. ALB032]|uniref:transposase n=1 Tax=Endozoicomonas sp. ALB032 TaxID=3403082 RepID=UPI003BB80A61